MPEWCIVLDLYKLVYLFVYHICRKQWHLTVKGGRESACVYFVLATDGKEVIWISILLIYMHQETETQWRDKIS